MNGFLTKHTTALITILAATTIASLTWSGYLTARAASTDADLRRLAVELERVESGAGLVAAEVTAFQSLLEQAAPTADQTLGEAIEGLRAFRMSTLSFDVDFDQEVPVSAVLDLDETFVAPIQTVLPIDEVIETTITIQGPLGTEIPLDVIVPVSLEVPIDLEVPIPISEEIELDALVPIRLTLPIQIDVADTELAGLVDTLLEALENLRSALIGFG